jgi:hypothetical protein
MELKQYTIIPCGDDYDAILDENGRFCRFEDGGRA